MTLRHRCCPTWTSQPLTCGGITGSDGATADGPRAQARGGRAIRSRSEARDLKSAYPAPPAKGECLHVVSNGKFDYFGFVGLILDWTGRVDSLYGSIWTMSRAAAYRPYYHQRLRPRINLQ